MTTVGNAKAPILYERVEVWKRVRVNLVIRFQCLRCLTDGLFAVQSADLLRAATYKADLQASDQKFVELLLGENPADRCAWFSSVSEAVSAHEREFADMPGDI